MILDNRYINETQITTIEKGIKRIAINYSLYKRGGEFYLRERGQVKNRFINLKTGESAELADVMNIHPITEDVVNTSTKIYVDITMSDGQEIRHFIEECNDSIKYEIDTNEPFGYKTTFTSSHGVDYGEQVPIENLLEKLKLNNITNKKEFI